MLAPTNQDQRDPRALNRMSENMRFAHGFLLLWGKWNCDQGVRAWPRRTMLGRIIDEGPNGALIHSNAPIPEPPKGVAVADRIVARLCQIDQLVLKVEYVEPWAMRETKARMAHMRPKKYENTLRRARERVYFGLAAMDFVPSN